MHRLNCLNVTRRRVLIRYRRVLHNPGRMR